MSKIVFVSGPSGMAKTTIKAKLERLSSVLGISFARVIITTSRTMRPGESQGNPWHFESHDDIQKRAAAGTGDYLTVEITGGDLQGLDTKTELRDKIAKASVLWCELDVNWRHKIEDWLEAQMPSERRSGSVRIVKVFFSPFSENEIESRMAEQSCTREQVIEAEMLRRLLARREAGLDNSPDEKLKDRAKKACKVLAERDQYDCIIVNHQ